MTAFEKFEVVKFQPYRFIGSSVYIGNKAPGTWPANNKRMFDIHDSLWALSGWIFDELDKLKEYASDEIHNAALVTWEKYDDKNALYGYYIGRFMKAGAPVPKGMDYFDINEEYMAKAWKKGKLGDRFGNMLIYGEGECGEEIGRTGLYDARGWVCMAEIYPEPDENGESFVGVYIPCSLK